MNALMAEWERARERKEKRKETDRERIKKDM